MEDITGQTLDEHVGEAVASAVERDVAAQADAIVADIQASRQARRDDIVKTAAQLIGARIRNKLSGREVTVRDYEIVEDRRHSKRQRRRMLSVDLIATRSHDGYPMRIGIASVRDKWQVMPRA